MLQRTPADLATAAPIAFAKHFVEAATLNQDQWAPVAPIAKEMQAAWENQIKPRCMDPVGRILWMLLLGGGGCGMLRQVAHHQFGSHNIVSPILGTLWLRRGGANK